MYKVKQSTKYSNNKKSNYIILEFEVLYNKKLLMRANKNFYKYSPCSLQYKKMYILQVTEKPGLKFNWLIDNAVMDLFLLIKDAGSHVS